jgi:hypothetical protein
LAIAIGAAVFEWSIGNKVWNGKIDYYSLVSF